MHSSSRCAQGWGPVGRLREHISFQTMTRAKVHAADILLRLLESRRRPAAGQIGSALSLGHVPIPAKQREVRFSDFESVAWLRERGGLPKDNQENWCRLWQQNPAMEVAKSQLSMGWVLETEQGIVGYQGSVPLLYQFGGRTLVAATGTGLVIEPEYRARGIGLVASFYRQQGVDLCLMTFAIASVTKLSTALRAKALAQHDYDKVLFWVLDVHQFTKVLAAKFRLGSGAAAVGTFLGSLVLRADALRRGPRGRLTNKFAVTEIAVKDIGDEFRALWQRKLTETPRLLADRSPASLRWHFSIPGSSSTAAVLCCRRFERLVGYAIVQHTIDRETGLRRSMLADILVEQDDSSVTETLLEAAYSNAVASGGHFFEVVGLPTHIRQILMRWNPYVRTYPTDPLIYKATDEGLARTLADENAWYAGPFDGDTTLMP
jgi:hypothetical protein